MKKYRAIWRLLLVATAFVVSLCGAASIQAAYYDANNDFSTDYSSGIWSYGFCDASIGPAGFTPYNHTADLFGDGSLIGWCGGDSGWADPNFNKNMTPYDISAYGITWDAGALAGGGDIGGAYATMLRWTCPADGTYYIDASFTGIQNNNFIANWLVSLDSSMSWLAIKGGAGFGSSLAYAGQLTLTAGQTLDFISHGPQHTAFSAIITDDLANLNNQWFGSATGNWTEPMNWTQYVPNAISETANFWGLNTAPTTVTVDAPVTLGILSFKSANSYLLEGTNAITLDNGMANAQIQVVTGSHTVSAPIVLNGTLDILANSSAELTISGEITEGTYAGAINLSGGGTLSLPTIPVSNTFQYLSIDDSTLNYTGVTASSTRPIGLGGDATIAVEAADAKLTLQDSFVSSATQFNKTGAGALNLDSTFGSWINLGTSVNVNEGTLELTGVASTDYAATNITVNGGVCTVGGDASLSADGSSKDSYIWVPSGALNLNSTATSSYGSTFYVDYNGVVNVSAGAIQVSPAYGGVDDGLIIDGAGNTCSIFNLTGGTASFGQTWVSQWGGYSMLNISGGTFVAKATSNAAFVGMYNNSTGMMDVSGGAFDMTADWVWPGTEGDITDINYHAGLWLALKDNSRGIVNVRGSGKILSNNNGIVIDGNGTLNLGVSGAGGGTSFVQTAFITNRHYLGVGVAGTVNFHGGKLVATVPADGVGDNPAFIAGNADLQHVYIYAEGAVIDTNGKNALVLHDLEAPGTGGVYGTGGVTTIPVTTGGSGYLSAPFVAIEGDGTGATAIAVMSTANPDQVDHIEITNPGVGYTTATFSFKGGLAPGGVEATKSDSDGVVTQDNVSGGLTKLGDGNLILAGNLTYAGITDIQQGTLELAYTAAPLTMPGGIISTTGNGSLMVDDGVTLTTSTIVVDTLTIGGTGMASASVSVPEPSSLLLLALAGLGIALAARRR